MASNDNLDTAPAGNVADDSYVSRPGHKHEPLPVVSDSERVEDPLDRRVADSDEQLCKSNLGCLIISYRRVLAYTLYYGVAVRANVMMLARAFETDITLVIPSHLLQRVMTRKLLISPTSLMGVPAAPSLAKATANLVMRKVYPPMTGRAQQMWPRRSSYNCWTSLPCVVGTQYDQVEALRAIYWLCYTHVLYGYNH